MMSVLQVFQMKEVVHKDYLMFLQEEEKEDPVELEDLYIARDYPKVFSKELPGLPFAREVEFSIELVPGSHPISKAPHEWLRQSWKNSRSS